MIFGPEESTVVMSPPRSPEVRRLRARVIAPTNLGSRVALDKTPAPGNTSAQGREIIWNAADPAHGNRYLATGEEFVWAHNGSGSAQTVTVRSAPDSRLGRLQDQVLTLDAGGDGVFGVFRTDGWRQADGYVWVDAASSGVKIAVLTPGTG
jgi:hypothetical protein